MRNLLLFIFFISLPAIRTKAQHSTSFLVQQFTTDNGMPSNGIKGMQWDDSTGFLWLATEAGIVRFNGIDFSLFTKENTPFITTERMQFLLKSANGKIYCSDLEGNIISIKKNKPEFFKKNEAVSSKPSGYGLFALSISDTFFEHKHTHPFKRNFSNSFDKILPVGDTSAYVVSGGNLYLLTLSSDSFTQFNFKNLQLKNAFKIGDECFVTDFNNIIFKIDRASNQLLPVQISGAFNSANKDILFFWESGSKNPIALIDNKAFLLNLYNNKIEATEICNAIPTDVLIQYVQYSPEKKLLFLGTNSRGFIVIKQTVVTPQKKLNASGYVRNAYYSQVLLPDGNILTNEGVVIGDQPVKNSFLPVKGRFGFSVSVSGDSILWYNQMEPLGKIYCLHKYNFKTKKTKLYTSVNSSESLVCITQDNKIFIVNEFGIGQITGDSFHYIFRHSYKNFTNTTYDVLENEKGKLLLATCSGLLEFDIKSQILKTLFSSDNFCIRTLCKYKNYIFFGTYGKGFYIMKNNKIRRMPVDKNNFLLYAHCFVPDKFGFCWISTNRGLFKAKLDEMINVFENNSSDIYYHYLGKNDGMDITEMNGGCTPCALEIQNGTISFPTMDGLLWVKPELANPILPDGEIFIDEIQVDNKKFSADSFQQTHLSANSQEIRINIGFSSWCNKENIYLEYQLNDTIKWKPVNTDKDAVIAFYNLPLGKYHLKIRKLNGFGFNNYCYKELNFTIETPWYRQWWFYIFCVLILFFAAFLYYKIRTKHFIVRQQKLEQTIFEKTKELQQKNEVLEKNNIIKTRLISIISHDIVTPLKFLTAAGKNLIEKRELMSEELQDETIKEITNTSQELQLLSTNILNWIKYQNENRRQAKENFNVHNLVKQVYGVLNSLAKQKKLSILNHVNESIVLHQFAEPLKILVYNLVLNAINFTEKGNIIIDGKCVGDSFILTVNDEGAGMTPEQIHNIMAKQFIISSANIDNKKGNGLGYLIIKELVKMLDADLQIESKKGTGTTVFITMLEGN